MAARVISFDALDRSSVGRAISELMVFRQDFMDACDEVLDTLATMGVTNAKDEVEGWAAVYTGNLENSIWAPPPAAGARTREVRADAPYAAFVEYGTGIMGAALSHPEAASSWAYDVNHHGTSGWSYLNPNDFQWHTTIGYMSRPFMYMTKLYLELEANRVTASVFAKI